MKIKGWCMEKVSLIYITTNSLSYIHISYSFKMVDT